jgi:hypothetical protein
LEEKRLLMAKGKAKVPRKVAGVKVPKAVRKSRLLDELLTSELGREILAEALVAAAGAVASTLIKKRPSAAQIAQAGHVVTDRGVEAASATKDLAQSAVGAVTEVVADAARHILPSTLTDTADDKARTPASKRPRRKFSEDDDADV